MYSSFICMKRLGDVRGPASTNRSELKKAGLQLGIPGAPVSWYFWAGSELWLNSGNPTGLRAQSVWPLCNQPRVAGNSLYSYSALADTPGKGITYVRAWGKQRVP